uniref:Secreted protein n=1 Tax=Malurus cyaneus samueli TaxID=2593467 RepID=A0A8C5TAR3_9PASS
MRILYLLFPCSCCWPTLLQGHPGSNKQETMPETKRYCSLFNCNFPYVIAGKCSRFNFAAKSKF